jgi:hypothetical protein
VNADRAPVGKTRDGGWQIGVSATADQPVKEIWDFLTSTEGTACGWATGSRSYVATARMRVLLRDGVGDARDSRHERMSAILFTRVTPLCTARLSRRGPQPAMR